MSTVPNRVPNLITVAGAVTPSDINHINAAGVLALTLAAPSIDGSMIRFVDETGHAHTITAPSNVINGNHTTLTFNGTIGSSVELWSRNGTWFTGPYVGITIS